MTHLTLSAHRDAIARGDFLRVVNYHNTPASSAKELRVELERYLETHRPLSFDEIDLAFETGRWADPRPAFVPVFYEGYRNSATVAAPICDELGITAWFPVCTGFVDCPVGEQEAFARSHFIGLVPEEMTGERIAMSWDEIADLAQRHVVFPHTASHYGIADVATDEEFDREIAEPKRRMDAATGRSAPAFVWLHGSAWGMSPRHDEAVRAAGYRYLVSNTMVHRIA